MDRYSLFVLGVFGSAALWWALGPLEVWLVRRKAARKQEEK